jgi:alginate O-acetyltransferase complex protein AlgI
VYTPAVFSEWVRRRITIPGSGDWSPFWQTTRALTITMFLSGLWHGSTANYIVWGLYFALIGTIWVAVQQLLPRSFRRRRNWDPILVPVMFAHTLVGMMIFREPSVARLLSHFGRNPLGGTPDQWVIVGGMVIICLGGAIPLVLALLFEQHVLPRIEESPWFLPVQTTAWSVAAVALLTFHRSAVNDFVYFQF